MNFNDVVQTHQRLKGGRVIKNTIKCEDSAQAQLLTEGINNSDLGMEARHCVRFHVYGLGSVTVPSADLPHISRELMEAVQKYNIGNANVKAA